MQNRLASASLSLLIIAAVGACGREGNQAQQKSGAAGQNQALAPLTSEVMLSHDPAQGTAPAADEDPALGLMQAQVVLERMGFSPGVVDGRSGLSTRNALVGFQESRGLAKTGELDERTKQVLSPWNGIAATRAVTIPADFAAGPFTPVPASAEAQAKLPSLGYQSLDEKLAERFHTTVDTLKQLNPQIAGPQSQTTPTPAASVAAQSSSIRRQPSQIFRAGQHIRVPNVGADQIDPSKVDDAGWRDTLAQLGIGTQQPKAEKLVVSKSKGTLSVYDSAGKLVALFTATMGSSHDPLPLGRWKVLGTSHNPEFHYNPKLFWDASDQASKQVLPPGPNGPVGVVWIDLNKPHYGIHGTAEPQSIGRAESHGCVRLTNWDAARLAQMVSPGTAVEFVT